MCKALFAVILASSGFGIAPVTATAAYAQEASPEKSAHYSVKSTLVGTLLADPAAVAILQKLIPTVYANEQFQQAGRALTLEAIQQYEPVELSNENLAKIQAEFDKIPAKG